MSSEQGGSLSPLKRAFIAIEHLESQLAQVNRARHAPIAIVGAGLRFPGGAVDLESYWQVLAGGIDAIQVVPPDRWDIDAHFDPDPDAPGKIASRYGGFVESVDQFDPLFFGISPREAERLDPQQRLLLETSWEALEGAGIAADKLAGSATGVFIGVTTNDYSTVQREAHGVTGFNQYYASGYAHSVASGRLSYVLGLKGPSISVDTACSSSLTSVHLAVQSLRAGECDLALAGGVNLMLAAEMSIALSRLRMLAPDGHCKAFDAGADGFVRSEGCGVIAVKRLDDAIAAGDPVLAVIRGSALNQDGHSSGLTAPNGPSQEAVIRAALADGGLQPEDVHYVEAHGTGTSLGDPIEARALGAALGSRGESGPLLIGSVKTNLGHLEAAAGIAGLLKVVLMLQHREIPPSLYPRTPSPHIPWSELPLRIPTALEAWPGDGARRVAGVSSFGFSGTNAHLILESAPPAVPAVAAAERDTHLLPLSANDPLALGDLARRYAAHMRAHPGLAMADIAASAGQGRAHHAERLAIVARNSAEAAERLTVVAAGTETPGVMRGRALSDPPQVAFMFTGQGAQYAGMGRQLYGSAPVFRAALDRCAEVLEAHMDRPLLAIIFAEPDSPDAALLDQTTYTQPALFAFEYALAELWKSWGVRPAAVMGHSLGEYVAACVAGVLGLEDALRLVAVRGRLMGALPEGGGMAAVFASADEVRAAIAPYGAALSVAALNGPRHTVISGEAEAVARVAEALTAEGVRVRSLTVSHAFHSALMEPALADLRREVEAVTFYTPGIRIFSNLDGSGSTTALTAPEYWLRQAREPVQFAAAVEALGERGYQHFLEIGPHPVLSGMGQSCPGGTDATWLPSLRKGRDEWATILDSLGRLYVLGAEIDWAGVTADYATRRVDLPTYAFQRQRYWVDTSRQTQVATTHGADSVHPLLGSRVRSALRETQYEAQIGASDFGYVNEHRVFERPILPGAAFVEMGLASAALQGSRSLTDLVIQAPLAFEESGSRVVQTIISPDGDVADLQIFSRAVADDDWSLHFSARLQPGADAPVGTPVDLTAIRARCAEAIDSGTYYAALQERGIELGPALQGLHELWRGEAEALAEINLPADDGGAYHVHPALLDAAFQTLGALVPERDGAYLPMAMERVRLLARPSNTLWCHARLRPQRHTNGSVPADTLVADLTVCDDAGRPVVDVTGLTLKRADQAIPEPLDRLFYEVVWQRSVREATLPAPVQLAERAGTLLKEEPVRRTDLESYQVVNAILDRLSVDYLVHTFAELGWQPQLGERAAVGELATRLGITERNQRLLERFLAILVEAGYLRRVQNEYIAEHNWSGRDVLDLDAYCQELMETYPDFSAELTLLGRCGPHLAGVLTGDTDPLHLLFPDGDARAAERLYTDSPVARTFNALVREALSDVAGRTPDRPLRLLEVGGGTGGTTAHVLPVLPVDQTEYVFTDISPAFTSRAAEKFSAYPFVTCRPLDIERDPLAQGFEAEHFDVVLAVNVIHAVQDVREALKHISTLLAPGGLLLLVEVTAPQRWIDLTFGLTDGWWHFTDTGLRRDYPLLAPDRWHELLTKSGFEPVRVDTGAPAFNEQSLFIARAPAEGRTEVDGDWLILADAGGTGDELAALIEAHGGRSIVVHQADVDPLVPADFTRLLQESVSDVQRLAGVVYLWGLDAGHAETLAGLQAGQSRIVAGALHTVQAVVSAGGQPRLWLVTSGAQSAGTGDVRVPEQATLWGLGKAIALEHPELWTIRLDLDPTSTQPAADLWQEIVVPDDETEVALRGNERLVARLTRLHMEEPEDDPVVELAITERGTLGGLEQRQATRRRPDPGEIEIRVHATGLNFKDVMNVLGMYPGDPGPLGGECAGVVVAVGTGVDDLRVGDDVIALAGGSFRSYITTSVDFVAPRPAALSAAEAATTAIAYVTASIALEELGQIRAGERVLIHAAAGGVGMAAVHIAQAAGAEVFATAGSPEKQQFLRSLGVEHIYSSRSLDFANEVLTDTGGEGVDLVLNSLSGDFVPYSLGLLRPNGRFLELGKRDHVSDAGIEALGRNIAYHVIDWSETAREDPARIRKLLHDVLGRVAEERLPKLPVRAFPFDAAGDAFHYMARARHIGKVAVVQPVRNDAAVIRPDGFYLITGGLRGLGLEVARRLVARGARHLLLLGRGEPSEAALATIAELEQAGSQVLIQRGDVSVQGDIESALATIDREGLLLAGVFHCAGVLADGVLAHQTWDRFRHVFAPKVDGAWLLDRLTAERPLDHFVLFSSVAAMLGSPGQANHSAANAFLDALAWKRRAQGLPALSINWGAWAQVGAAADRAVSEHVRHQGLEAISPEQGLDALETLLRQSPAQAAVASVRWSVFLGRFTPPPPFFRELLPVARSQPAAASQTATPGSSVREALEAATPSRKMDIVHDFVQTQAELVLGLATGQIGPHIPLNEYGLDSLMAVELRNRLGQGLALSQPLPATLAFDYPSVEEMVGFLASTVLALDVAPTPASATDAGDTLVATLLDNLSTLSDAEIDSLLADRASQRG